MKEHNYRISEIVSPVEEGQRPEYSAAVIGVQPPINIGEEFIPTIVGSSRNVSIGLLCTNYTRIPGTGQTVPSETLFTVHVGGNHYNDESRTKAIKHVARRICELADDPLLAIQMRSEDPVPHRPGK